MANVGRGERVFVMGLCGVISANWTLQCNGDLRYMCEVALYDNKHVDQEWHPCMHLMFILKIVKTHPHGILPFCLHLLECVSLQSVWLHGNGCLATALEVQEF